VAENPNSLPEGLTVEIKIEEMQEKEDKKRKRAIGRGFDRKSELGGRTERVQSELGGGQRAE